MKAIRLLPALAALGLAACGGGDDGGNGGGSTSADEAEIRRIIHSTSEQEDPSKCSELATPRFLEQIELQKDRKKALDSCRKSTKTDVPADSVDIHDVKVNGTKATASYTQHGGDSDGQRFTVEFVKTDHWRFDHLAALKIDRPSFEKTMRASLIRPPNALGEEVADCSVREVKKLSDSEIESAVVNSKAGVLIRPIAICAIAGELRKARLPNTQVECAARKTIDALSDAELEATLSGSANESKVQSALRKALAECGSGSGATS